MWIVRLALRRPYTFVVMAMLIAVLGGVSILSMPKDIFPVIDIPVVSAIWSYGGLSPDEMQNRITTVVERAMTTTVNDIEHIESQSLRGISIIKTFFQPGANVDAAVAQVNAISETLLRPLPPGITPPLILQYNASNVPVLLLSLSSDTLAEQELNDYANSFIRTQLVTVRGSSVPLPYGGKSRQVMADLDSDALYARGLSPQDVSDALLSQNVILPAGTAKMGTREYDVALNGSPEVLDELNRLPIKYADGGTVYMRDVAHVHDGFAPQTNLVRRDSRHSVLLPVLKSGGASTLDVVAGVKALLPKVMASLPPTLQADLLFDQSIFVRTAISGVLREGLIAAGLTALMILLFLGSARSTVVVATSIPLSILVSIIVLKLTGQTLNVMTLGGLALAVGILVDDATVEIENIHRNAAMGKPLRQAILDGAQQIAVAAFVSTLSICIVFVPIFALGGAAGSLFWPLALAVVSAMMASYLLSRTLVPTMVLYLLSGELGEGAPEHAAPRRRSLLARAHDRFNAGFEALARGYGELLAAALERRRAVLLAFGAFAAGSLGLLPFVGRDFFPAVDAGQLRLHVRAPTGTRLEETERLFEQVEEKIRTVIPPEETAVILDNIGIPNLVNLALSDSVTISSADGEILVALKPGHGQTAQYLATLREMLPKEFPELTFFAQPADMVSQILNFGLPAPIDVQISGPLADQAANYQLAQEIASRMERVPGAVDVHVHQVLDGPRFRVNVDRSLALQAGLTQNDVASSVLLALTGSGTTNTNFWLNPKNGVSYLVAVQTPQHRIDRVNALQNIPISFVGGATPQLLGNLASVERATTPVVMSHYNVQPVVDVYANVQGTDLGSVADAALRIVADAGQKLSKASTITIRGQAQSMREAFVGLGFGIAFAVLFVYFLMVVNFQSWLEPFIILMALPGALAGILWMLFATGTTINVPSLMGCIMAIGVATSNSILLITFANEQRAEGLGLDDAARSAGRTRLRPVLMTALAMAIGMLPMSLGLGEGGEQNAPLGRAVIGGLTVATAYTLVFVPLMYTLLMARAARAESAS